MQIEFIFTFHKKEQVFDRSVILPEELQSKTTLLDYAFEQLKPREKEELVKISCCVYDSGEYKCPYWYIQMNGKYWLNDIEGYRYAKGIKSRVPRDYVLGWLKENKETLNLFW